jgi:phage terminase small subunit
MANVARTATRFKTDSYNTFLKEWKLKRPTKITAPNHLRPETKKWFLCVMEEYELEDHHVRLLTLACESRDRATLAREAIAEHGLTYTDRFNSPSKRPEISVAEAATIAFARLTRELDLDCGSPAATAPPPLPFPPTGDTKWLSRND